MSFKTSVLFWERTARAGPTWRATTNRQLLYASVCFVLSFVLVPVNSVALDPESGAVFVRVVDDDVDILIRQ